VTHKLALQSFKNIKNTHYAQAFKVSNFYEIGYLFKTKLKIFSLMVLFILFGFKYLQCRLDIVHCVYYCFLYRLIKTKIFGLILNYLFYDSIYLT